jgi:hypothetical protein
MFRATLSTWRPFDLFLGEMTFPMVDFFQWMK